MNDFFSEPREQSIVKATIVCKYFPVWAKLIVPWAKKRRTNVAYVDLFAGPGHYDDGTKSTPIRILEMAVQDADLQNMLVAIFNDEEPRRAASLRKAIAAIPGIEKLRHAPRVESEAVGSETARVLGGVKLIPSLFFVDPCGYKGLSLELLEGALKNWGCECIFFFNYNRINPGLSNSLVEEHMNALFGAERAEMLRADLVGKSPDEREETIVSAIQDALNPSGGRYTVPFPFRRLEGSRTSHYLMFVTKNDRARQIMREIMAGESSTSPQGVPSFEFNPHERNQEHDFQMRLFELDRPLDDLGDLLSNEFAGQTLTMGGIYDAFNVGRPFVKKSYKAALQRLEAQGRIVAEPPAAKRKKNTFADDTVVTFPPHAELR